MGLEEPLRRFAATERPGWRQFRHGFCCSSGMNLMRVRATVLAVAVSLGVIGSGFVGPVEADRVRHNRVQTGYATFLSAYFHGREAASGEIFDRTKMIAAHRTLPFDTVVRVTNLENRRSVTVRIVDRGPYGQNFREGTIIDLSRAAAQRLDMIEDGQVRVRVQILKLGSGERRS